MRPIENKIPLFYITIFFYSSFSPLTFSYTPFFWTYYLKRSEYKILYISKSYFYFSSFLFSLSFSALYYILQKMLYRVTSVYKLYFPIVVIEEGAFYRAPFKSLFSYNFTETKTDAMNMHIELMNNKLLYS